MYIHTSNYGNGKETLFKLITLNFNEQQQHRMHRNNRSRWRKQDANYYVYLHFFEFVCEHSFFSDGNKTCFFVQFSGSGCITFSKFSIWSIVFFLLSSSSHLFCFTLYRTGYTSARTHIHTNTANVLLNIVAHLRKIKTKFKRQQQKMHNRKVFCY